MTLLTALSSLNENTMTKLFSFQAEEVVDQTDVLM